MTRSIALALTLALGLLTGSALGCGADTSGLATLSVPEVAALLDARDDVAPCDANNADTRAKYGVIPGAILLSSYRDYQTAELPTDRALRLVFYCYNDMCRSAAAAARRAIAAGYTHVYVMPDGIQGWVAAERATDRPAAG